MKYIAATLACFGVVIAYNVAAVAIGWRHGGGLVPMAVLLLVVFATWRGITKGWKVGESEIRADKHGELK